MALTPVEKKSRLLEISADLPGSWVERHFQRLDSDYWNEFPAEEIHSHLLALKSLTFARPNFVGMEKIAEGLCALTLIGGDHTGFFAALSGFLAADGYDIRVGKGFTFAPDADLPTLPRGGIIDFLVLHREEGSCDEAEERARLQSEMQTLFRRFESGDAVGVRVDLYRRIGERLEKRNSLSGSDVPLEIRFHALNTGTQVAIRGRDREAMLFCISSALSLQGLSIEKLLTTAHADGSFEDRLTLTGPNRQPVHGAKELEKIRVSIALMERLLETLPAATDLQAAAEGLQALVEDWLEESSTFIEDGSFDVLPALSRVLTAGPHMWEMVDRLGPKSFRGMLQELTLETVTISRERHLLALQSLAATESDLETLFARMRVYRERELLKAELDLLLTPSRDLNAFSGKLVLLAEALLIFSLEKISDGLAEKHGQPCAYCLFALGKFGGEEMGSGSDLEILLIYSEAGETSGPDGLRHGEFYGRVVSQLSRALETRSGETLALDFRLRPHGDSGPMAASLAAWKEYFSSGGSALDYEKQALIRLRPIHGDRELAGKVLSLRDAFAYSEPPVPIAHTLELHAQQIALKAKPGIWNAKYSRGGLAELEYAIQFLQLEQGAAKPSVRQHNLARAMESLLEIGVLSLAEFEHLYAAHIFLRRLINSLRLVRGQARDLHCPSPSSPEFSFLSKRLGYVPRGISAEAQLERDLKQAQRVVGGFFRARFLGDEKPDWLYEGLSETLMDSETTLEEVTPALSRLGMRDLPRAQRLFRELFSLVVEKRLMAACLLQFEGRLRRNADPEGLVQKLNRYLTGLKYPDIFIRQALQNPVLLEILFDVFANSDMLSDWVIREGESFKILAEPESLEKPRLPQEFMLLAAQALRNTGNTEGEAESQLCRIRNREYLRIALRDLRLNVPLREITYEISKLSDALVDAALKQVLEKLGLPDLHQHLCVLALGKLGGLELNYSSDIDLVFVMDDAMNDNDGREKCEKAGRELIAFLTRGTSEGRLFRVDMNLRPWGGQGPLVGTLSQYSGYFAQEADGWELQAWIKARPVCGSLELGMNLIRIVQGIACAPENRAKVEDSMRKVRLLGLDKLFRDQSLAAEVKLGPGGIRTVEFYAQTLQIHNAAQIPELITGNTLEALGRLNRYGLLAGEKFHLLSEAYVFLRRVEHRLQLQALQQRHALPTDSVELERLARQMGFEDRIGQPAVRGFLEQYRKNMLSLQSISAELFAH